jgi:two-component system chemotaxis sensor kinase CheA
MPLPASNALALDLGEPATRPTALRRARAAFALGKYREIIFAVAFFLLFDLAVLVLNFYVSYQIAEDAVSINLSGRERMLTQRLSKVLFAWELAASGNDVPVEVMNELQLASQLFDTTLIAFRDGGAVTGGDGKPVYLPAAAGPRSADILARADAVWAPWRDLLQPLRSLGARAPAHDVAAAAAYARVHNLELLGLMNELTTDLETAAGQRAGRLRQVQTAGIALALVNFVFILLKFVRRLRQSDASVEQANEENREILSVVREGLFLLTPQFHIGTQISSSVGTMFGRAVEPGDTFAEVLGPLVSAATLHDAQGYVELLFAPHVSEALVQSINPLSEVELSIVDALGKTRRRHLSLQFNRVMDHGEVRHLLVTVQDVTTRVELERRLQGEQQRAQREFDLLMRAFETEPVALRRFVEHAESALLKVNELLRHIDASCHHDLARRTVDAIHRHVHGVKGEASMLGLDLLSATAHEFESQLQSLREAPVFSGDALLALPLPLEELLTRVQTLKRWGLRERVAPPAATGAFGDQLAGLVQRIATQTGRPARLSHQLGGLDALPSATREALAKIAVQLVRNAAVHGIDPLPQRLMLGKPSVGAIEVALESADADLRDLVVRDDGGGLDADRVRARLLELKWFSVEALAEMTPDQVVSQIFRPGFSTASAIGEHAGRGVGLDLVVELVRQLGARLLVSSRRGQGTELRVRLVG